MHYMQTACSLAEDVLVSHGEKQTRRKTKRKCSTGKNTGVPPGDIFTATLCKQLPFTPSPPPGPVVSLRSRLHRPRLARLPGNTRAVHVGLPCLLIPTAHSRSHRDDISDHMNVSPQASRPLDELQYPNCQAVGACYSTPATILLPCKQTAHDHTLAYLKKTKKKTTMPALLLSLSEIVEAAEKSGSAFVLLVERTGGGNRRL